MVYVLLDCSFETNGYSGETIEGVFSTREKACKYLGYDNEEQFDKEYNSIYKIQEWKIDELIK